MAAGAGAFAWATFPSMPTRRVYCSAAHRDGQLFVLGGCGGGGRALGTAEVLDLPAQRWTTLPPLPTPRAGAAALTLGKQILVVGGVDAAQSPLASVEVYHVDEGKWEKKAALAQPSMGISAVQRDGAVYALGGMGADTSPQALVRVYEPAKDHWQPLPSMPTPCYGASAFLQGNKIFVLGGRQGKLPVTAFEAFDLETRSWTRYPSVPSRRAFAACAMADGVVFSLGGLQQPGPHNFYSRPHFVNTVEMFDPAQGAWRKPNRTIRMREKRADFVAGYLGGRVVAVGGLGNARACGPCFPLHPLWHISDLHDSGEVGCAKPQGYCNTVCIHIPFVPSKFQEDPTALSQRLPHWAPCLVHLQNTSGFFQLVCSVLGLHSPQWLNPTVQGCSCIPLLRELRKG
ncbi:kelch domain-containing protein 8B isoform X1 [Empidonax traillii]|uniref:kelch domain-containing protein 8B isoform X1 n=1 Tax=Empidonax traillii TaxID=164674 RepID=UPI000FFD9BDA|nr:kelch domain-containing protein 8B isoform X1 [Empidonax traillii]XP_027738153.1 kelch domain-containing protein 8B isoform X1 [Empidonax traillii]XP_027738154.1 kelch domain-containing protein 8B isoform X1 [Empidonax traillii]